MQEITEMNTLCLCFLIITETFAVKWVFTHHTSHEMKCMTWVKPNKASVFLARINGNQASVILRASNQNRNLGCMEQLREHTHFTPWKPFSAAVRRTIPGL